MNNSGSIPRMDHQFSLIIPRLVSQLGTSRRTTWREISQKLLHCCFIQIDNLINTCVNHIDLKIWIKLERQKREISYIFYCNRWKCIGTHTAKTNFISQFFLHSNTLSSYTVNWFCSSENESKTKLFLQFSLFVTVFRHVTCVSMCILRLRLG